MRHLATRGLFRISVRLYWPGQVVTVVGHEGHGGHARIGREPDCTGGKRLSTGFALERSGPKPDWAGQRLDWAGQQLDWAGQQLDWAGQQLDWAGQELDCGGGNS